MNATRRSSIRRQRLLGDWKSSAPVVLPPLSAPAAIALTAVPDRGRRVSQGLLLQASILARFLGLRLLKLDAVIVLLPADIPSSEAAGSGWQPRSSAPAPRSLPRTNSFGQGLSEAVRDIEESRALLARARHSG